MEALNSAPPCHQHRGNRTHWQTHSTHHPGLGQSSLSRALKTPLRIAVIGLLRLVGLSNADSILACISRPSNSCSPCVRADLTRPIHIVNGIICFSVFFPFSIVCMPIRTRRRWRDSWHPIPNRCRRQYNGKDSVAAIAPRLLPLTPPTVEPFLANFQYSPNIAKNQPRSP